MIGLGGVSGHIFDIPVLLSYSPNFLPKMVLPTALGISGLGLTLLFILKECVKPGRWRCLSCFFLAVPLAVSSYYLFISLMAARFDVVALLATDFGIQIPFLSAFCHWLCATSLLAFLIWRKKPYFVSLGIGTASLLVMSLTIYALIGYWQKVPVLYDRLMALPTTLAYFLTSLALLIITIPFCGILQPLISQNPRIKLLSLAGFVIGTGVLYDGIQNVLRFNTILENGSFSTLQLAEAQATTAISSVILASLVTILFLQALLYYDQQTQAQKATLESERRFRMIADEAPMFIFLADADVQVEFLNKTWLKSTGLSFDEAKGRGWEIVTHPDDLQIVMSVYLDAVKNKRPYSFEVRQRNISGEYRWIFWKGTPRFSTDGEFMGFMGGGIDIHERKQAEEELSQSYKDLSDIKNALDAADIVATTDKQGTITYVNDAFCRISKFSRGELLGQNHRIINSGHHPSGFFKEMWAAIGHGQVWKGEIKNRAKDDTYYWVDTTIVPFLDDEGKPYQYVAIRHDITERKQAELELRQLKDELEQRVVERTAQLEMANKELESFSYSISHDLRAPLRSIDGFSKLVMAEQATSLDEEGQRYLSYIRENSQRMGQLIDDLLKLSRVSRAEIEKQPVHLSEVAQQLAAELQRQEPDRTVEFRIKDNIMAEGDPTLLRAVLQNLIGNAWKFTSKIQNAVIEFDFKIENGLKVYFVRDNGAGFDPQYATKLFGAFQRLHAMDEFSGTGIGLATVKRIIVRHGGEVWAEGVPNQGATFYFTLASS